MHAPDSPFTGIEKAAVLQEARMFNDPAIVRTKPRKCAEVLTRLLYLLLRGDKFAGPEATEVFFGVTKLFQSKDVRWPAPEQRMHCVTPGSPSAPDARASPHVPVCQGGGRVHSGGGGAQSRACAPPPLQLANRKCIRVCR